MKKLKHAIPLAILLTISGAASALTTKDHSTDLFTINIQYDSQQTSPAIISDKILPGAGTKATMLTPNQNMFTLQVDPGTKIAVAQMRVTDKVHPEQNYCDLIINDFVSDTESRWFNTLRSDPVNTPSITATCYGNLLYSTVTSKNNNQYSLVHTLLFTVHPLASINNQQGDRSSSIVSNALAVNADSLKN